MIYNLDSNILHVFEQILILDKIEENFALVYSTKDAKIHTVLCHKWKIAKYFFDILFKMEISI